MAKAKLVLSITESTRTLLKMMSFPEIPENVKYIVFWDDEEGNAQFFEDIKLPPFQFGDLTVVWYHKDVEVVDIQE